MDFDLTSPCAQCPFRKDVPGFLTRRRAQEIVSAIREQDGSFPCHKTVDYDEDGEGHAGNGSKHCAGAIILLEKARHPNQLMRIAERLGIYDHRKMKMDAPVFDTFRQFVSHHNAGRKVGK